MRPAEDIEKMVRNWNESTSAGMDDRVLADVGRALERSQTHAASAEPHRRRRIMGSPIPRIAAAAVFVAALGLFVGLMVRTVPPAYGLEQTVQASHGLRCLHMKSFAAGLDEPKEFWLQCDESGQIEKARWHMPSWDAPEDGAKVVVWKDSKIQLWFKGKPGGQGVLATYSRQQPPFWLLDFARSSDPRLRIAQLKEAQAKGKVELEIDEPMDRAQPILVTATYLPQSQSPGRRLVLRIDPTTKLVASVETYALEESQYRLQDRQEFSNYNVPIDPAMFDLETTVPATVRRVDGDAVENRGLPQGTLRDDEIATKVVRQFFEALIAQDYETAGQLYCGTSAEEMKQGFFGKTRIIRIVSIDKPTPHPIPEIGGLRVPCKVEIEKDGVRSMWEPFGPFVRTTHRQDEHPRWEIHGGL